MFLEDHQDRWLAFVGPENPGSGLTQFTSVIWDGQNTTGIGVLFSQYIRNIICIKYHHKGTPREICDGKR